MELLKAYLKERRLTLAAFLLFVGAVNFPFPSLGLLQNRDFSGAK